MGVGSYKDREDQSIEDPFRVNGAEFLSTALPHSCQAAIQSDTQRETVGGWERKKRTLVLQQCLQASEREAKKEECPTIELIETLISMGRYAMQEMSTYSMSARASFPTTPNSKNLNYIH